MADKDDVRQLTAEVRELAGQVRDLTHQVRAAMDKNDALAERAKDLEQFREKAQPNLSFVNTIKLILIGGAVAIIGAALGGAFWLGSLASDVKHQGEDMAAIRKDLDGLRDELKQVPRVREGKVAKITPERATVTMADGSEYVIHLTPDFKVTIDGKPGTLAEAASVKPGSAVAFTEIDGKPTGLDIKTIHP